MSTLFTFAAPDYASQFKKDGYVLIKNGVSTDFLDHMSNELQRCMQGQEEDLSPKVEERRLKQQYLFEFPNDLGLIVELVTTIGRLTGLPVDDLIISERHLKVYRSDAPQDPPPHKDRRATQIAIGIPIAIPSASRLVLYPYHERSENTFDSYDEFIRALPEAKRPENALKGVSPVVLDTHPGDVVVFWGSTTFHERLKAAGSQILYLKLNALGLDPIGENLAVLPLKLSRVAAEFAETMGAPRAVAGELLGSR
jgi:hypothetical protein